MDGYELLPGDLGQILVSKQINHWEEVRVMLSIEQYVHEVGEGGWPLTSPASLLSFLLTISLKVIVLEC